MPDEIREWVPDHITKAIDIYLDDECKVLAEAAPLDVTTMIQMRGLHEFESTILLSPLQSDVPESLWSVQRNRRF